MNEKLCPILLASGRPGMPNACLGKQCGMFNHCNNIIPASELTSEHRAIGCNGRLAHIDQVTLELKSID